MSISIPIGREYASLATATEIEFVKCESCGSKYVYRLMLAAVGKDSSLLWLDNKGAQERAVKYASQGLRAAVRIAMVPCPKCGWYQADMVKNMRENAALWPGCLGGAAAIALAIIGGSIALSRWSSAAFGAPLQDPANPTWWFVGALVLGVLSPLVAIFMAKTTDPNRGGSEERASRAQASMGVLCVGEQWLTAFLQRQPKHILRVGSLPGEIDVQTGERAEDDRGLPPQLRRAKSLCQDLLARVAVAELDRALAEVNEAMTLVPELGEVYNRRGVIHLAMGERAEAADASAAQAADMTRMLNKQVHAAAYGEHQRSESGKPNYRKAVEDFQQAIALDAQNATALENLGIVHHKLGEYQRAIEAFTDALRVDPNSVISYHNRALAYEAMGNYTQAIADHGEAIRLQQGETTSTSKAWLYNSRGVTHAKRGDFDSALNDFDSAIRMGASEEAQRNRELVCKAK